MRINVHSNTKVTDEAAEVKLKASRIRGIMGFLRISAAALLLPAVLTMCLPRQARANGDIHKIKHVIIVMQENPLVRQLLRGPGLRTREPLSHDIRWMPP